MSDYEGPERRQGNIKNLEILIEMRNDMKHFIKSMEQAEKSLFEHKQDFKEHVKEDTVNFKSIEEYVNKAKGAVLVAVSIVGAISTMIVSWIVKSH